MMKERENDERKGKWKGKNEKVEWDERKGGKGKKEWNSGLIWEPFLYFSHAFTLYQSLSMHAGGRMEHVSKKGRRREREGWKAWKRETPKSKKGVAEIDGWTDGTHTDKGCKRDDNEMVQLRKKKGIVYARCCLLYCFFC